MILKLLKYFINWDKNHVMTTKADQEIIHKILDSPNAPTLFQQIKVILKEEQRNRVKFYNDISEQEKAEFINGEVIIHSPVMKRHNEANSNLHKLIDTFVYKNQLGFVGIEKILIQLTRNDYEPDICFFKSAKAKNFKSNQSLFPPPDFIAEVLSKGTAHRDRGIKFEDYAAHGVQEYWIIDPKAKVVEQYLLTKNNTYNLNMKTNSGDIESDAIKGFKVPVKAIFDKKRNYEALEKIMES